MLHKSDKENAPMKVFELESCVINLSLSLTIDVVKIYFLLSDCSN